MVATVTVRTDDKLTKAFKLYKDSIFRLSYSYMNNDADAEDVLQDTMVAFMTNERAFKDVEHEKAWLFRVAINLCKNKLKSSWSRTLEIPDTLQAKGFTDDESEVWEAVHDLSVKYREVVHLYYYEGYSTAEISLILKKNESTVRSLLHRSRNMLRETLKGACDFDD